MSEIKNRTFGQSDQLVLVAGDRFDCCVFDNCEIVGDVVAFKGVVFTNSKFDGRAAEWFMARTNESGCLLMTVDVTNGEIIPGPASDRDPSFPGHLRRN